ncbi:MAG TPA: hypothetical protein VJP81_06795 [Candidatus Dormibacteraeota bacterium]|nr:hypothetical protein [Candidatus Dormibacteraeota bacterium]
MVRHRMHLVAELGKYREAIAWVAEMNGELRRLGLPEWKAWAPLTGEFNSLILESDYDDLSAFEAAQRKFQGDPQTMTLFRKGNEWGSSSHWPKDEVLESAPTIA